MLRKVLEPLQHAVAAVRENEAGRARDLDREASASCVLVGNAEQRQRRTGLRFPDAFDRRDLRRLMLERVETVQVAEQDLQRREHRGEQHARAQHALGAGAVNVAQDARRTGAGEQERGRQQRGDQHVREAGTGTTD